MDDALPGVVAARFHLRLLLVSLTRARSVAGEVTAEGSLPPARIPEPEPNYKVVRGRRRAHGDGSTSGEEVRRGHRPEWRALVNPTKKDSRSRKSINVFVILDVNVIVSTVPGQVAFE